MAHRGVLYDRAHEFNEGQGVLHKAQTGCARLRQQAIDINDEPSSQVLAGGSNGPRSNLLTKWRVFNAVRWAGHAQ